MSTNSVLTRCEQRAVHFFQRNLQLNIHLSSYNSCFFKPDSCFFKGHSHCPTTVGQLPHNCGATKISFRKTKIGDFETEVMGRNVAQTPCGV